MKKRQPTKIGRNMRLLIAIRQLGSLQITDTNNEMNQTLMYVLCTKKV